MPAQTTRLLRGGKVGEGARSVLEREARPGSRRRHRWRPVLRPRPLRKLPPELRPDRVVRLAETLEGDHRGPAFLALLQRIDHSPLHASEAVRPYFRGEAAFASMLDAIEAAREEVLVESYILRDDFTGRELVEALGRARARGVVVRVLADALGSSATHAAFWAAMGGRGIDVRLFHRLLPHLWAQAFRDHRKILVVDRRVAFTGGMNIGDDYGSSRHARGGIWRDTHVRVEGTVAWEMAVVFAEGWTHAGGDPFDIAPREDGGKGDARILVLDSRPGRGHAESASVLAAIVGAARESVWITNSYFAPMRSAMEALTRAARRGVDVRLLLPGLSDVPLIRHAGHGYFDELLAQGVKVFEYQGAVLHAKTLVADAFVSIVGSSNLDFRSFRFNAECNLVILEEATAVAMAQAFRDDVARARAMSREGWSQRGGLHRLGDSLARVLSPVL